MVESGVLICAAQIARNFGISHDTLYSYPPATPQEAQVRTDVFKWRLMTRLLGLPL